MKFDFVTNCTHPTAMETAGGYAVLLFSCVGAFSFFWRLAKRRFSWEDFVVWPTGLLAGLLLGIVAHFWFRETLVLWVLSCVLLVTLVAWFKDVQVERPWAHRWLEAASLAGVGGVLTTTPFF